MPELTVGRTAELEIVDRLLETALIGEPRHLLFHGGKGSGKTHLVRRVAGLAQQRGFQIVTVDVAATTAVINAVIEGMSGAPPSAKLVDLATLRTIVEQASQTRPILLSFDNIDARPDAAAVVSFLIRHLRHSPTMVVATYRRDQLPVSVADQFRRHQHRQPVTYVVERELKPLDCSAISNLLSSYRPTPPPQLMVHALRRLTGGSPGLCVTLLNGLRAAAVDVESIIQSSDTGDDTEVLPSSVRRQLIESILVGIDIGGTNAAGIDVAGTGGDEWLVASAVAVGGTTQLDQLGLVAVLTGIEIAVVRALIDQLVAAGTIAEHDGVYRHTYPIISQALYYEVDPLTRRQWHRDAAKWLSAKLGRANHAELAGLARHLRRGAHRQAPAIVAAIRQSAEATPFADPIATAMVTGNTTTAVDLLTAALAGKPQAAADLILERGWLQFWQGQLAAAQDDLDAARHHGAQNLALSAALQAQLSMARGESSRGLRELKQLEARLETFTEPTRTNIGLAARIAAAYHGIPHDYQNGRRAVDTRVGDRAASVLVWSHACDAVERWRQGRFEPALRAAVAAIEIMPSGRADLAATTASAVQIAVLTESGAIERALDVERSLPTEIEAAGAFMLDWAVARLWCQRGDFERCLARLDKSLRREQQIGRIPPLAMLLAVYIDVAVTAGETSLARRANDRLQSLPVDPANIAVTMHQHWGQARAATDLAAARSAHAHATRYGLMFDAATARRLIGEITNDATQLQQAHDEFASLGANVSQTAVAIALNAERRPDRLGTASTSVLSPEEHRVAELVATGLSNRETAQRMHLSSKTIEAYLTRIYVKTGCRSRVELAIAITGGSTAGRNHVKIEPAPTITELVDPGQTDSGPTDDWPPEPIIVGGAAVRQRVATAIDQVRVSSESHTLVMAGDLGRGKSTWLDFAVAEATRRGFAVFRVDGDQADRLVAYSSLRLALAQLGVNTAYEMVARLVDGAIAAIDARSNALDAVSTIADRVAAVLAALVLRAPLVLSIDDLDRLDRDSAVVLLRAVQQLAQPRLFIVATMRDESSLEPAVADELTPLRTGGKATLMALERLTDKTMVELIESTNPPAGQDPETICERAGGVPLFALDLSGSSGNIRPGTVTAILSEIDRIGRDALAVATAVAVSGHVDNDPLGCLSSLTGLSTPRVKSALDRLLQTSSVTTDAGGYCMVHPLIGRALYETVGPATRRHWHAQLVDRTIDNGTEATADVTIALARHLRHGDVGRGGDTSRRIAAAGDLLIDADPKAAADWYRAALERLTPDDSAAEEIKLRLSDALMRASDFRGLSRVADSLARGDVGPGWGNATVAAIESSIAVGDYNRASELIATANGSPNAATLAIYRAVLLLGVGDISQAESFVVRARRHLGNDNPMLNSVTAHIKAGRGEFGLAEQLVQQVIAQTGSSAAGSGRSSSMPVVLARLGVSILAAEEFDPAVAMTTIETVDAGVMASPWSDVVRSTARLRQGFLSEAATYAAAGLDQLNQHTETSLSALDVAGEPGLIAQLCTASLILARVELGDLAAAQHALSTLDDGTRESGVGAVSLELAAVSLLIAQANLGAAAQRLERVEGHLRLRGHVGELARVYGQQVYLAKVSGDAVAARTANARLQDVACDQSAVAVTLVQLHAEALVNRDVEAAERAYHHAGRYGLQLGAARAQGIIGSLRDDPDRLFDTYLEFGRLGAVPAQRWIAKQLRRLGRRVPSPRGETHGMSGQAAPLLTAVEQGIAVLVSQGLTNREIASKTNLSPKTIEVYLSRIYRKTECSNRVLLAVAINEGRFNRPFGG